MKYLIIISTVFLFGCSTIVPVKQKFPEAPALLLEKCAELNRTKDNASLSEIVKTVTLNYSLYHECSSKHDAFISWYETQKKIFEDKKK